MSTLALPALLLRHWLPSLAFAICFLYLDFHALPHSVYAENFLDQALARPAGFITLILLPAASYVYLSWTDAQFAPPGGLPFRPGSWLLADLLPWLVALLLCYIQRPLAAYTLTAASVWALLLQLRYIGARARMHGTRLTRTQEYIAVLFFMSGFSALIYQIVWQRVLFAAFGMDSESITIIISVFMAGLGAGALLGSWLVRFERILLRLFLAAEIGIGIFGVFSIPITQSLLQHVSLESRTGLALMSYALFALPTLFMGTTLPLLVGHLDATYKNPGRSTGLLYAANTLGAALAALLTVSVILVLTGQRGATVVAAFFNLATALLLVRSIGRLERPGVDAARAPPAPVQQTGALTCMLLSAAVGFVALSVELLYYRLLGFATGAMPQVFGWLLAAYLCGIAASSYRIKRRCELALMEINLTLPVYGAGLIVLLTPAAMGLMAAVSGRPFALLGGLCLCGTFGYLTGGILPYLCAAAGADNEAGNHRNTALVYASNILGSALGPLATGYFLLEYLPAARVSMLLALALLAIGCVLHGGRRPALVAGAALLPLIFLQGQISDHYLARLQQQKMTPVPFKSTVENRVSIITVTPDSEGDIVYGGGVYDGRINIDPLVNANGIQRAFYTACLQPRPRRLLEIGLSSGAWARVMLSNRTVQSLTSIEINHGYGSVISASPVVRDILENPRLRLVYDDGRRWLRRHPGEKFDLIVMNTTFHWRANASNLLSLEFFRLVRAHLHPGGVFYFNATGSIEAAYTAAAVFNHVISYGSFYAASDAQFDMPVARKRDNLLQYLDPAGRPYFLQSKALERLMHSLATAPQTDIGPSLRADPDFRVITDDNMLVEYKLGMFQALE